MIEMIFSNVYYSNDTPLEKIHQDVSSKVSDNLGVGYSYIENKLSILLPDSYIDKKDDVLQSIREIHRDADLEDILVVE